MHRIYFTIDLFLKPGSKVCERTYTDFCILLVFFINVYLISRKLKKVTVSGDLEI